MALVASPEVDLVVETIGGTDFARDVVMGALSRNKPVVTANKNLLARFGDEIQIAAADSSVPVGIEAAVAGGIPVLRAIREGMSGDRLLAVYGILNGTTNYILTRMQQSGIGFEQALREAQDAGYAESDPSNDVEGIDSRDKLCILARMAFHCWISETSIPTQGISNIKDVDIEYAGELDSNIRLVGCAEANRSGLSISVRPWVVSRRSMLGKVEGVNNAVFLVGGRTGRQMFYGPGAGARATGAAVISDVVEIGRAFINGSLHANKMAGFDRNNSFQCAPVSETAKWYLRLTVRDRHGIIADVARLLAEARINIDSVIQKPNMPKDHLSFVITIAEVEEALIRGVVERMNRLEYLICPVLLMRLEPTDPSPGIFAAP
jgi:homoserine dehydrogenase